MKVKTETTFDLTEADVKIAVAEYINKRHDDVNVSVGDVSLKITDRRFGSGPHDEDMPARLDVTVVTRIDGTKAG
jgi:hypothetical protein